jgi:prepilin-type N-terminal cleavage/methylation domain-containing protein
MTLSNKLKQMRRREEGFTIVELLIVIVVIAILAALVITAYLGIQARARDAERQSDIRAIVTAVQAQGTIDDGAYVSCPDVTTANVDNLEAEALEPPQGGTYTPNTAITADSDNYGCVSTPAGELTGETVTGLRFSYWSEVDNEAVTRDAGEYVAP